MKSRKTCRPPVISLYDDEVCIDGFAGGGGTSTGIEMALGRSPDIAVNHDAEALAMHEANHPTTHHIRSNIKKVNWHAVLEGRRCGFAWFSPDCTFHSKARGGKPFRNRNRARRIRGLAWEMVRCAIEIRPRVLFMENVEELADWGPLDSQGLPIPAKRGQSWRQLVARIRNIGYVAEWRELVASHYGAPTTRKRLVFIARCDGQPIVWPARTHGPTQTPYRTAAECIDFSLPVPSIFLTPKEAKAWGKTHGVAAPRRPLATATMRRIARGIQRFVIESPEPFIIKYHASPDGQERIGRLDEPLSTLDTSNRYALVTPFLAGCGGRKGQSPETPVSRPYHTITAKADTILVAPTLIQTSYGERQGQAPRTLDLFAPLGTIVAGGIKHSLVAAFLAKHNGGHEATGQNLWRPTDTIVCRENKALVTSHLLKLKGTCRDGHPVTDPMPTVQAQGTHLAEVRAFLVKYYGTKKDGRPLNTPLDTITTKERYALATVTIAGDEYVIVDIGMRMLTPRELFKAQGFPATYEISQVTIDMPLGVRLPIRLTKKAQTRLVGNSVPPDLAAAIVGANMTTTAEAAA